jgi:hypothetical protein
MRGKVTTIAVVIGLAVIAIPIGVHALTPYQSGYRHGVSDAKKAVQGRNDWYILQPGKWCDIHTGQFIQGYVEGFNSVPGIPKDYQDSPKD